MAASPQPLAEPGTAENRQTEGSRASSARSRVGRTTMALPVMLPDPTLPPQPAQGCDVCAALDRQRAEFDLLGNVRRATDCEVEIRDHPEHGGTP
ncbi:hypothetical protein [Streptomyces apocyni]|uniref:hypothetical protein n=1 Tax=Streptomyces apocyni TaxID=2654677 RepID=UPI001E3AA497|nr:hypothetical protein [Streptomyces apocyni]